VVDEVDAGEVDRVSAAGVSCRRCHADDRPDATAAIAAAAVGLARG